MKQIVQKGDSILRQVASVVPVKDITKSETRKELNLMSKTLLSRLDGIAIAAPQVGISKRMFIVSGKIDAPAFDPEKPEVKSDFPDLVFINPVIIKRSKKKRWVDEGCLSVNGIYGQAHRSTNVTVEAYNENGIKFTRGAGGLLAQIFQHEIDHLDGILFTDQAKDLYEHDPTKS